MNKSEENILFEAARQFEILPLADEAAYNRKILVDRINYLLQHDFDRLISILYRMDVSEVKLKDSLEGNPGSDAATIISVLVIERQLEKITSRQNYRKDENISDEDRW